MDNLNPVMSNKLIVLKPECKHLRNYFAGIFFQYMKKDQAWDSCCSLCSPFGELSNIRLPKKVSGTGSHRGFCFVDYATAPDAKVSNIAHALKVKVKVVVLGLDRKLILTTLQLLPIHCAPTSPLNFSLIWKVTIYFWPNLSLSFYSGHLKVCVPSSLS